MVEAAVGFWIVGVCKMEVEAQAAFKFYSLHWTICDTELDFSENNLD